MGRGRAHHERGSLIGDQTGDFDQLASVHEVFFADGGRSRGAAA
jgi:hypothetical protein